MSFRKLEEKTLGDEPAGWLIAWCPTMDLVAFVTGENHIAVHRLSWAKLVTFTATASAKFSALVWSPDGGAIAAGHEDGHITIFDVESGEAVRSLQAHCCRITCIEWRKWTGFESSKTFFAGSRCHQFLPELNHASESSRSLSKMLDRSRSVLLVGDCRGTVSIRISGTFLIGTIQACFLPKAGKINTAHVKKISLSPDLSTISVLLEETGDLLSDSEMRLEGAKRVEIPSIADYQHGFRELNGHIAVLNTSVLNRNSDQLFQISSHAWVIECILLNMQSTVETLRKTWKEAWDHMSSKLQAFEQQLRAHDSGNTIEAEFLICIANGCASPALQAFLVSLREQGVRRWEKVMDTGCVQIQQLINQRLIPATQNLVFRAGELLGLARWDEEYASVGLREAALEALLSQGEIYIYKASEVQAAAQSFHTGITQLCRWLERLTLRLINDSASSHISSQDALIVAKFVKDHLGKSQVSSLLDETATAIQATAANYESNSLSFKLLSALEWGKDLSCTSLSTQTKRVKEASDLAFEETKIRIGEKFDLAESIHVYTSDISTPVQSCLGTFEDSSSVDIEPLAGIFLAFSCFCEGMAVRVLRLARQMDGEGGLKLSAAQSRFSIEQLTAGQVESHIVDLHWYGTSKLAALSSRRRIDVPASAAIDSEKHEPTSALPSSTCAEDLQLQASAGDYAENSALTLVPLGSLEWTSCFPDVDTCIDQNVRKLTIAHSISTNCQVRHPSATQR